MTATQNYFDNLRIVCFELRRNLTIKSIAKLLGRHHTTIIHHIEQYSNLMTVDKQFQNKVKDFRLEDFKEAYFFYRERKTKGAPPKVTVQNFKDEKK